MVLAELYSLQFTPRRLDSTSLVYTMNLHRIVNHWLYTNSGSSIFTSLNEVRGVTRCSFRVDVVSYVFFFCVHCIAKIRRLSIVCDLATQA